MTKARRNGWSRSAATAGSASKKRSTYGARRAAWWAWLKPSIAAWVRWNDPYPSPRIRSQAAALTAGSGAPVSARSASRAPRSVGSAACSAATRSAAPGQAVGDGEGGDRPAHLAVHLRRPGRAARRRRRRPGSRRRRPPRRRRSPPAARASAGRPRAGRPAPRARPRRSAGPRRAGAPPARSGPAPRGRRRAPASDDLVVTLARAGSSGRAPGSPATSSGRRAPSPRGCPRASWRRSGSSDAREHPRHRRQRGRIEDDAGVVVVAVVREDEVRAPAGRPPPRPTPRRPRGGPGTTSTSAGPSPADPDEGQLEGVGSQRRVLLGGLLGQLEPLDPPVARRPRRLDRVQRRRLQPAPAPVARASARPRPRARPGSRPGVALPQAWRRK